MNIMSYFKRVFGTSFYNQNTIETLPKEDNNSSETESLNILFSALIAEYSATRQEILLHIELHERNNNYLLLIIAAFFSILGIFKDSENRLFALFSNYPIFYLGLAFIALIFPILYMIRSNYALTLERYQQDILSPKIDKIARLLAANNKRTNEFIIWENESFKPNYRGLIKWQDYSYQKNYKENFLLFSFTSIFRYLFVSIPSVCLFFAFIANYQGKWNFYSLSLMILFCLVAILLFFGIAKTAIRVYRKKSSK